MTLSPRCTAALISFVCAAAVISAGPRYAQTAFSSLHARCTPLSAAWKYPIVPSFGMCATFKVPAAFAGELTPSTNADATSAPADRTERIFFKISSFRRC
jgi:TRAP-type C4-dicarboxylate transport system permease small subunit